jgi:hypothetical protein
MLVKDMFEKNGHNPSCGFAGDIVSYLYDEIDAAEKLKFETHLAGCTTCGAEIAAFSGVRASVADWREADFGWLPSPDIVIPYEKLPERAPAVVQTRGTILTDLRRIFSFTPWPPAFAALGALAILAGLAFFGIRYLNRSETTIADNRRTDRPIASPTAGASPKETTVATGEPPVKQKAPDEIVKAQGNTQPEPVRASTTPVQPKKVAQPAAATANPNKPGEKNLKSQKAPSLNNYAEEEDSTLRLADLFEEIDTRE